MPAFLTNIIDFCAKALGFATEVQTEKNSPAMVNQKVADDQTSEEDKIRKEVQDAANDPKKLDPIRRA